MDRPSVRRGLISLGATAAIAQALLIREAMTTLGGSEIAWGILLTVWLLGAAAGAFFASCLPVDRERPPRWGPMVVALTAVTSILLLRSVPTLAGVQPGGLARPLPVLLIWLAALLPPSTAVGLSFSAWSRRVVDAAVVYGLECFGATLGGLMFSFALVPWGTAVTAGALLGLGAASLFRKKFLGSAVFILGILAGHALTSPVAELTWRMARRSGRLERSVETPYRRIEISRGIPRAVYADGRLSGTLPADPFAVLPRIRLLSLIHPAPRRITVIGGLTDGSAAGLFEAPFQRLTVIEEDRRLLELMQSGIDPKLSALLSDSRTSLKTTDAVRALHRLPRQDLIIVLGPPPSTLRTNRNRTLRFLELCRSRLRPRGIVVLSTGVDSNSSGAQNRRLLTIEGATFRAVFPSARALAGNPVFLVGSTGNIDLSPDTLIARLDTRTTADDTFRFLIPTLLDPTRSEELSRTAFFDPGPLNTIDRPVAVLPAAALAEGPTIGILLPLLAKVDAASAGIPALVVFLIALSVAVGRFKTIPRKTGPALAIGAASMTWYLLLLASWQAGRGTVYSEIGALTAVFMAGTTTGSFLSKKRVTRSHLRWVLLLATILSIIVGFTPGRTNPLTIVTLLAAGGLLTGAAFPGAALLADDERRTGAGRAFAADEAGAALAALLIGTVGIPWIGIGRLAPLAALLTLAAAVGMPGSVQKISGRR